MCGGRLGRFSPQDPAVVPVPEQPGLGQVCSLSSSCPILLPSTGFHPNKHLTPQTQSWCLLLKELPTVVEGLMIDKGNVVTDLTVAVRAPQIPLPLPSQGGFLHQTLHTNPEAGPFQTLTRLLQQLIISRAWGEALKR